MHASIVRVLLTRKPVPLIFTILLTAAAGLQLSGAHRALSGPLGGRPHTRVHYIAADEVLWNYAPAGRNLITGQPFGEQENVFVQRGPQRIGSTYLKAIYREYTDATFSRLKTRPADQAYLGDLAR